MSNLETLPNIEESGEKQTSLVEAKEELEPMSLASAVSTLQESASLRETEIHGQSYWSGSYEPLRSEDGYDSGVVGKVDELGLSILSQFEHPNTFRVTLSGLTGVGEKIGGSVGRSFVVVGDKIFEPLDAQPAHKGGHQAAGRLAYDETHEIDDEDLKRGLRDVLGKFGSHSRPTRRAG